jgi:3-deoxy-manno-octulosonate cytidylyltransferase (CMP-KDO synthetase)
VLLFVVHPSGTLTGSNLSNSSARRIVIIPARYASTRFPGKPLADLDGRPLIEHVYRRAAASRSVDQVIVATDDARIADAVERFGGEARLTSRAHRTGTDRLAEVAADLACDLVVNVQGDEPLLEPGMIDEAIAPFVVDPSLTMTTLRRPIHDPADLLNPNIVKVVVDRDGFALYFSRAPLPFVRGAGPGFPPPAAAHKHVGLYVYRREFLLTLARLHPTPLEQAEALEQLRVLEHGYRIKTVVTAFDSIGVDTPEDLERVRRQTATEART